MPDSPVYDLLSRMEGGNIILAYKGEISSGLLEAVYSMMDKHLEERKESPERRKKFFSILIECLQNVFHHQSIISENSDKVQQSVTGFVIRNEGEGCYNITTGNSILNSQVDNLKSKIDQVNSLSAEELREEYKKSLSEGHFSEKGGAGLGIIEMARKSGKKLRYEFKKIDDDYSFFSLAITIP